MSKKVVIDELLELWNTEHEYSLCNGHSKLGIGTVSRLLQTEDVFMITSYESDSFECN